MPDQFFTRNKPGLNEPAAARRGVSMRAVIGTSLLAFVGGALLVGYLAHDGRIAVQTAVSPPQGLNADAGQPAPGAAPTPGAAEVAHEVAGFDERIAALEQRLARIDLQSAAAEGNTARAEALLVAFAARRSIERGVPLGYLADQLTVRFGAAQPEAVKVVIAAARDPVTLDQLSQQLDALGPALGSAPSDESGWATFKREIGSLFVIRRDSTPSTRPADRLERAKLLLRTGQVDSAIAEVERMPGSPAASAWIASGRRYANTLRALDLIETTALLDPARLRSATGASVKQQSPAGAPPAQAD